MGHGLAYFDKPAVSIGPERDHPRFATDFAILEELPRTIRVQIDRHRPCAGR
jgi:hypothetical protein